MSSPDHSFHNQALSVHFVPFQLINLALLHKSAESLSFPHPRTESSRDLCDGYAERDISVQEGNADLELSDLTIKVPRAQALAQQFHAMHLGLDAASAGYPLHHRHVARPRCFRGAVLCFVRLRPQ